MVYILHLAVNDLRNILRDRFFVFAFIAYPVLLILFSRIMIHMIAPRIENIFPLAANFAIDPIGVDFEACIPVFE